MESGRSPWRRQDGAGPRSRSLRPVADEAQAGRNRQDEGAEANCSVAARTILKALPLARISRQGGKLRCSGGTDRSKVHTRRVRWEKYAAGFRNRTTTIEVRLFRAPLVTSAHLARLRWASFAKRRARPMRSARRTAGP